MSRQVLVSALCIERESLDFRCRLEIFVMIFLDILPSIILSRLFKPAEYYCSSGDSADGAAVQRKLMIEFDSERFGIFMHVG